MKHINDEGLAEAVSLRTNNIGIFRDEFQTNIEGRKQKLRCLYLSPPSEVPPKPEQGTKWYTNMLMEQPPTADDKSRRASRVKRDDNFNKIRDKLSQLVREAQQEAVAKTKSKTKARSKPPPAVDTNRKTNRDEFSGAPDNSFTSHEPCAKKPKVADPSSSLKDFVDTHPIADTRLTKLIARIAEGNNHSKFQLTKEEIVSLMNFFTAQCIAKLARLATAKEMTEQNENEPNNNVANDDSENTDESNEPNEPNNEEGENDGENVGENDGENDGEPIEPNEPNDQNEANETNNRFYANSTVNIGNQELELPNSHSVISRSKLSRLQASGELARKLKSKIMQVKQYRSSGMGRRYYNSALYQAPRLSTYMAEQIFPLIIAGFLADAGIAFKDEAIASSCPSAKTLNQFIVDGSIDSILWLEDQFRDASAIFIACDKGKRKGIDHFPKVISWWSTTDKKVCSACIDADGSGGTSDECAQAIWHSIKKFRGAIPFFYGQTTDSGGGGVLHSLQRAMARLLLCSGIYFIAPCTLHGMNLIFANSVKAVFGEGGLDYRNVMQLMHSLYDLVGRYEPQQVRLMWEAACGEAPPGKISKAVLTRWWWVNVAAQHLKDNWVQWRALAQGALNNTTANTAAGKIASSILSLMDERKIQCDLYFMVAFSRSYFVRHI
jgi:hypothetical protein